MTIETMRVQLNETRTVLDKHMQKAVRKHLPNDLHDLLLDADTTVNGCLVYIFKGMDKGTIETVFYSAMQKVVKYEDALYDAEVDGRIDEHFTDDKELPLFAYLYTMERYGF